MVRKRVREPIADKSEQVKTSIAVVDAGESASDSDTSSDSSSSSSSGKKSGSESNGSDSESDSGETPRDERASKGNEKEKSSEEADDIFAPAKKKRKIPNSKTESDVMAAGVKRKRPEDTQSKERGLEKVKRGAWSKREASTLYLNQIPYKATEADIRKFICTAPGISENDIAEVRMVKDKKKMFKGIAFVELVSQEKVENGLKLSKTKMMTRVINVTGTRSRKDVWEERNAKAAKAQAEQKQTPEQVTAVFESVSKKLSKSKIGINDFDKGIQKFMCTLTEQPLRAAVGEYCKQAAGASKLKNRNSFFMAILQKHKHGARSDSKKKEGETFSRGTERISRENRRVTDVTRALTVEQVNSIVISSAAPKRSKKQKDGGRAPPSSAEPLWSDFSSSSLSKMQEMSAPELKRTLAEFYKSKGFENIKDKSKHFDLMLAKAGRKKRSLSGSSKPKKRYQ